MALHRRFKNVATDYMRQKTAYEREQRQRDETLRLNTHFSNRYAARVYGEQNNIGYLCKAKLTSEKPC